MIHTTISRSYKLKIGIIGAGFVGFTFATVLASKGYNVDISDSDQNKVDIIRKGNLPFYEPTLLCNEY